MMENFIKSLYNIINMCGGIGSKFKEIPKKAYKKLTKHDREPVIVK